METASTMVDAKIANQIGVITLNNPRKQNALSKELMGELCAALEDLRQREARVIILRAPAGSKVFSSGHDVRELPTNGRDPLTYNDPMRRLIRTIETVPRAGDCNGRGHGVGRRLRTGDELRSDRRRRRQHVCDYAGQVGCALQHLRGTELPQHRRHAALQGDAVYSAADRGPAPGGARHREPCRPKRRIGDADPDHRRNRLRGIRRSSSVF